MTIVEPGTFATDFASTAHVVAPDEVYAPPSFSPVRRAPAVRVRGFADVAVGADAIDGIRAALESRPAALEKSAQRGRLAQQH